jgi:hypothetical protein
MSWEGTTTIMSGSGADDSLFVRLLPTESKIQPEEIGLVRRLMIAYGIMEEAYELYEKGWIDKATWDQWDAWLMQMCKIPHFAVLHQRTAGMFDRAFQEHVSQIIKSSPSNTKDGQESSRA